MSGKEENRIFIGGLSWNTTQRRLEQEFGRFGKVIDAQVMMERDTGRPRGFGFVTFTDPRSVKDAISDMHNRELDGRVISVNKAEPKMGSEEPGYGASRGRASYHDSDGRPPAGGSDVCYKCGRHGHWARECPDGAGGGKFSSSSRYGGEGGGGAGRGDRFGGPDRYGDDRYDGGRYNDRSRIDNRERFGGDRDRYATDRYGTVGDRVAGDRYGGLPPDRYPHNGYNKERSYERDGGPRGGGGGSYDRDGGPRSSGYDKYGPRGAYDRDGPRGGAGSDRYRSGPIRYEGGGGYRDRPGPYDRPSRGGRSSTYDDRY